MVFDPIKRAKAIISVHPLGAIAGGIAGVWLVKKYLPMSGIPTLIVGALGGSLGGAYAQYTLKSYTGNKKSNEQAKS